MIGWHHQLHGHEFEQAPAVGDGQGDNEGHKSLACYSPWDCRVKHNLGTEQQKILKIKNLYLIQ